MTVFQRTPSYVFERANYPTDPEWVKSLKPGWRAERQRNFHNAAFAFYNPGEPDLICDGWTEVARNLAAKLNETNGWAALADPKKFLELKEIEDYKAMERLRQRVEAIVEDPETAEKLKPYYRNMCKRPVFNDEFLPTFNRDNVTLIDVSETKGVERITEKGIIADGVEHEFDCIVFASGFEITTASSVSSISRRSPARGNLALRPLGQGLPYPARNHGARIPEPLRDRVRSGRCHGCHHADVRAAGRPHRVHHQTGAVPRGHARRADVGSRRGWVQTVRQYSVDNSTFTTECTPGYYNSEGEPNGRSFLGDPFWGGFYELTELLENWRSTGDLEGLVLEK